MRFALLLLTAAAAFAQQLDPTVTVARIPAASIVQLLSGTLNPSPDVVQVWVSVTDQRPALAEVVLKYDNGSQVMTAVSTRRLVAGFDIHSFPVPAATVKIVSISVSIAPIAVTKDFPGDF